MSLQVVGLVVDYLERLSHCLYQTVQQKRLSELKHGVEMLKVYTQ